MIVVGITTGQPAQRDQGARVLGADGPGFSGSRADVEARRRSFCPAWGVRKAVRSLESKVAPRPLAEAAADGRPFLGICLGMQLLYEASERTRGSRPRRHPGKVVRFTRAGNPPSGMEHGVWREASPLRPAYRTAPSSILRLPIRRAGDASWCPANEYGVPRLRRAAGRSSHQFHPEKSQASGLRLLSNFVGL